MRTIGKLSLIAFLCATLLISCSEEETSNVGRINISLTDAPIDDENVKSVWISILGVTVKGEESLDTIAEFDEPLELDLLKFRDGNAYLLTEAEMPAGEYKEIRLLLDVQERGSGGALSNPGCYIEYNDGSDNQPLFVPSGGQSGYKAKGDFEIPAGGVVGLTIDFDVRKSVVKAGNSGKYLLKPVLRLVANQDVGIINGSFIVNDSITVADESTEITTDSIRVPVDVQNVKAFAYADDTFTTDELDENEDGIAFANAVTSGNVDEEGLFTLAFMESGTYDLYFASYDDDGIFVELLGNAPDVIVEPSQIITVEILYTELE